MSILTSGQQAPKTRGRRNGNGVSLLPFVLRAILLGVIILLPVVEAGSWFITRVQLEDDAGYAAFVASNDVNGLPTTTKTASTALDAAQRTLTEHGGGGAINPATLRLFEDGTVRFTAHRTAPSPLLGHLDWTKDVMDVHVEVEGHPAD